MSNTHRLLPPWSIKALHACFTAKDSARAAKPLTREVAELVDGRDLESW
jgi:hypothetical protein